MTESVGKQGLFRYSSGLLQRSSGVARSSSSTVVGRKFKSREMVFLKKRTEVEPPKTSSNVHDNSTEMSVHSNNRFNPVTASLSNFGFIGKDQTNPESSSQKWASKTIPLSGPKSPPLCPYQYLYYLLLLEYTTDKSFRIIDPAKKFQKQS